MLELWLQQAEWLVLPSSGNIPFVAKQQFPSGVCRNFVPKVFDQHFNREELGQLVWPWNQRNSWNPFVDVQLEGFVFLSEDRSPRSRSRFVVGFTPLRRFLKA